MKNDSYIILSLAYLCFHCLFYSYFILDTPLKYMAMTATVWWKYREWKNSFVGVLLTQHNTGSSLYWLEGIQVMMPLSGRHDSTHAVDKRSSLIIMTRLSHRKFLREQGTPGDNLTSTYIWSKVLVLWGSLLQRFRNWCQHTLESRYQLTVILGNSNQKFVLQSKKNIWGLEG